MVSNAQRTCCLIGIRTQESYHRWQAIHRDRNYHSYKHLKWTHKVTANIFNAYPIYDWLTTDIWTANGKFQWDYNHLYDLYYQAGVPLERQRVASPFISQALSSLKLYRAIDPDTWGKMINRVNGVNFTGLYGGTSAMGWQSITLPENMTWSSYFKFLLCTRFRHAAGRGQRKLLAQTLREHGVLAKQRRLSGRRDHRQTPTNGNPDLG